jgi:hypothetical protein
MAMELAGELLGVSDGKTHAITSQLAGVTDLAAGFGVERGGGSENDGRITGGDCINRTAILEDGDHGQGIAVVGFVTQELGRLQLGDQLGREADAAANLPAARAVSRWCSIAASKPAMSTVRPRSRAMSAVRSTGKP